MQAGCQTSPILDGLDLGSLLAVKRTWFAAASFPDVVEVAARALNLTFDPACDAVRLPAGPGKEVVVKKVTVEIDFAGRKYSLTTGELAKQASGAVMIQHGDTSVFVAAQTGPGRPGIGRTVHSTI